MLAGAATWLQYLLLPAMLLPCLYLHDQRLRRHSWPHDVQLAAAVALLAHAASLASPWVATRWPLTAISALAILAGANQRRRLLVEFQPAGAWRTVRKLLLSLALSGWLLTLSSLRL